jgi:hypothetical protein
MKKLVFVMTALLCAQVLAVDAAIWCVDEGSGVVAVNYQANGDANLPRGFGLEITLDNDANIVSVTDFADGSNDGANQYWVYPGSVDINEATEQVDAVGNPGVGVDGDSNNMIIEMGSLHSPPEYSSPNAPALTGTLCKFTVDASCNVSIAANTTRGKVVFYDATNEDDGRTVSYTGCAVVITGDCFPAGYTTYSDWVTMGKPDCWCEAYQCDGDADGATQGFQNYRVFTNDLTKLAEQWKTKIDTITNPCADIDHKDQGFQKYRVFTNDLQVLADNWKKKDADLPGDCPRPE